MEKICAEIGGVKFEGDVLEFIHRLARGQQRKPQLHHQRDSALVWQMAE